MKLSICLVLAVTAAAIAPSHGQEVDSRCAIRCSFESDPVCGSDGVTYTNQCLLILANCDSVEEVTLASKGACKSAKPAAACVTPCPKIFAPMCGSDGVTYENGCQLAIAQCESGGTITRASEGQCPDPSSAGPSDNFSNCPDLCAETYEPVCGSDGITHNNICMLRAIACYVPSITLAYEGECKTAKGGSLEANETMTGTGKDVASCPDVCPAVYTPVCGSNGMTYGNACELGIASCKNPDLHLTKVSDGACADEQPHQNC
ncbi:unnamed protein product [Hyaloperonospora brassicae]|uniref:Kazal-like domain-containing protein n=1 Tax=Hyaloperonospora brassicae TaxID=162125 RepID=A0AAV0U943_HYABA|nr:unnamed protein product [Hyaloperonospora brassicae]